MSAQDKQPQPSYQVFKNGSQYLSGDIGTELTDENNFFGKGSVQLLKHHGTYKWMTGMSVAKSDDGE